MENNEERTRILVVDDEEAICDVLQYNLTHAGYHVDTAGSAEEALFKMKNDYDLLLLDIMMEGISGLKLAKIVRDEYKSSVPIIFITALDTEKDVLAGFDIGADDYIAKPFSVKEVVARVRAVLSRCVKNDGAEQPKSGNIVVGELLIDGQHRVFLEGREIILTKKEAEILVLLASHPGKIFSRQDILDSIWKNDVYVLERTVDVHIARLRKKLDNYGEMIVNRSGYGYSFRNY